MHNVKAASRAACQFNADSDGNGFRGFRARFDKIGMSANALGMALCPSDNVRVFAVRGE